MRIPTTALMLPAVVSAMYSIWTADDTHAQRALPTATSSMPLFKPTPHKALVSAMSVDPVSTSSLEAFACAPSESACASASCFNPTTQKCCPGNTNICNASHNCVQVATSNGTVVHGCCPFGIACGDQCIDTSVSKCCAVPGGRFGTCPASSDCCGNMCCDAGLVCVRSSDGPQCWPVGAPADSDIVAGASPTIKGNQHGDEQAQVVDKAAFATFIPGPGDPERNGSVRLSVSIWLYVLLLLTPFATALSRAGIAEPETNVNGDGIDVARRDAIPADMTGTSEPIKTLATTISTSTTQQEVQVDLAEKKGGVRPGAGNPSAAKGTGSRTISLETMWPLILLALPQILAPLALAQLAAGSVTRGGGAPTTDMLEHSNDLSVMPTATAATLVPEKNPTDRLSEKKEFKFGSGSSLGVESRPKAMTMLMLCALPLFVSLLL